MAKVNANGEQISYACEELIAELKSDMLEFGTDFLVEVVTEEVEGVKIYKDYNFLDNNKSTEFALSSREELEIMKPSDLLAEYTKQNEIL